MNTALSDHARELQKRAFVCDLTVPWHEEFLAQDADLHAVLARFRAAGVDMLSMTVAAVDNAQESFRLIAKRRRELLSRPDRYRLCYSVEDIEAARAGDLMAIVFHFQGTHPFERNLDLIEPFYRLGIRQALLAYNERTFVGDGCHEPENAGLSKFGRLVVGEMNRVGMLIDCTHTGIRTSLEAIELSSAPVVFSHANPRALFDHERNITDEQIKACAASGGVVGINGVGLFNGADTETMVERMTDAMIHVAQLVGVEHVALGSDFMFVEGSAYRWYYDRAYMYPKGYSAPPWLFVQPEQLPHITDRLIARGLSDPEIEGILGLNYLRVARSVWR